MISELFDVSVKELSISGDLVAVDKPYDGTPVATVDATGLALVGVLAGQDVKASFAQAPVGEGLLVSLLGSALVGADATNSTLSLQDAPTEIARITPKTLSIGDPELVLSKVYDGSVTASVTVGSLIGVLQSEMLFLRRCLRVRRWSRWWWGLILRWRIRET